MSSEKNLYCNFFKRDKPSARNCPGEFQFRTLSKHLEESEGEISSNNDIGREFNNEDKRISRLYREVVDDVMTTNKLRESTVDSAMHALKQQISTGNRNGFRKFLRLDFRKPENCCGYMRRYAICYTGLVKKSVWNFLTNKMPGSRTAIKEIIDNNQLRVVSLGGGPGNDLVGFCSALEEIPNSIQELELIVVDINKGWENVFPEILRKAKVTDYGSFSQFLRKKIMTGFMEVDLTNSKAYKDKNLSLVLGQADVLLMVNLTSFLSNEETTDLLHNVIDSMKPQAKLIFIDQPYDEQFFHGIESLDCIYSDTLNYELSFNPRRSHSPSINNAFAHAAVFQKIFIQDLAEEDAPDDDDS